MKAKFNSFLYLILAVIMVNTSACSSSNENTQDKTTIEAENIVIADYTVDGMVCAMGCAKTIQDELSAMNGIASCEVNFDNGKAHVEFDKTQLSENEVIKVIEGLADGQYKVTKWNEADNQITTDEVEGNENTESSVSDVNLPSFEMPNLFELLFRQL